MRNCNFCLKEYEPHRFTKNTQKYCSAICRFRGSYNSEDNKRAKDKERYGGLREVTILRDKEKCVSCGMTRQEHRDRWGKDLTVDHKDGKGFYTPKNFKNNKPDNLQTLCLSCHNLKDYAYMNLNTFK